MINPIMQRVDGHGIQIQLAVWEGEGRTILCVHGLTANCRCWDRIASVITPYGRIVAPDLRGRGRSDKPTQGYSIKHHVEDIHHVLQDQNLEGAVLLGHSLGAYICLAFAARYPDRVNGLILMDGGGALSQHQWDEIEQMIQPSLDRLGQVFPSFDAYTETLKQAPMFQPWSSVLETYFQYEAEEAEGGIRSGIDPARIQKEIANIRQTDVLPLFSQIACPTLILRCTVGIFSQNDLVIPEPTAEKMAATIEDAHLVNVEGANHFTILFNSFEQRDRAVLDFLAGLG